MTFSEDKKLQFKIFTFHYEFVNSVYYKGENKRLTVIVHFLLI